MSKSGSTKIIDNVPKEYDFSFVKNTTYGCGGIAKIAYFPKSIRQAVAVYNYLVHNEIKYIILGNGSNILASDKFFDGAVISTKLLTGVYRTGANTIFCRAGTKVSSLLKYCAVNGFGGLEYLAGIPASLGGLVFMNGEAGGKCVGENVAKVKLFDGKIRNLQNNYCHFGHKYSIMRDINSVILGVELKFVQKSSEAVKESIAQYLENRSCQPKGKSCGCVFKNVGTESAGKIIDEAGLKGLTIGCAKVSDAHANFIINSGARSSDVYALINEVKRRVYEQKGILLEEEVVYIGDFNDTFS